ncbi:hypothetical protein MTCD1_00231 [Colwellia marinimaniae]|uniref:Uncharacterized protein n=1 Tax=Colwellia marinimaniae TaxID=1513592 RepID=A0ABQ0MQK6_9GAMM|nr:hypothetical protein MTCD1_00231 [Colwellia marinimaniae]
MAFGFITTAKIVAEVELRRIKAGTDTELTSKAFKANPRLAFGFITTANIVAELELGYDFL